MRRPPLKWWLVAAYIALVLVVLKPLVVHQILELYDKYLEIRSRHSRIDSRAVINSRSNHDPLSLQEGGIP